MFLWICGLVCFNDLVVRKFSVDWMFLGVSVDWMVWEVSVECVVWVTSLEWVVWYESVDWVVCVFQWTGWFVIQSTVLFQWTCCFGVFHWAEWFEGFNGVVWGV